MANRKLSFKEKMAEFLEYIKKYTISEILAEEIKFTDNFLVGKWWKKYKNKINDIKDTNELAKEIMQIINELTDEEKIAEIFKIYEATGELPNMDDPEKFSDNSDAIGYWLYKNKKKIIKYAATNYKARVIAQANGWLKLTDEEKINEIYEIYEETGNLPTFRNPNKFSDGSGTIGHWLYKNKEKIIKYAETNYKARVIAQEKGWSKPSAFQEEKPKVISKLIIKKELQKNSNYILESQASLKTLVLYNKFPLISKEPQIKVKKYGMKKVSCK